LISANERLPICGLQFFSFSYDIPQDVIAQISGYLHVNKKGLTELRKLLSELGYLMIESSEILYGPPFGLAAMGTGGSIIRSITAACEGCDGGMGPGTRRLEDWVGKSSDEIGRAGRLSHLSADRRTGVGAQQAQKHAHGCPP
jgi:hypothetical protein